MDLKALRYFEAVFETGSVSAAARACYVSQPSISAAIQQLEETLGARLFVRHPRGVLPTQEAEKLYPMSRDLTGKAKSILHLFKDGPASIPLRLGIMRSLGAERMGGLLKKFSATIPDLELTLVDPDEPCDARIIDSASLSANDCFVPVWDDHYRLALPVSMAMSHKAEIELNDFEGLPFIQRNPCLALDELKSILDRERISYQVRANIRTVEYAQSLVSAGVGAALLPDWEEMQNRNDFVLKPVVGFDLIRQVGLAYKKQSESSPLIKACVDICQSNHARQ